MQICNSVSFNANSPTVIALGCFDGVHIGHRRLISKAGELACELGVHCAVWSFKEPPKGYFSKSAVPLITTEHEKAELMEGLGVDIFLSLPFDRSVAELSPMEFFEEILINRMKAAHIVCGFNYRFGRKGQGDIELMAELCESAHIGLTVVPEVSLGDVTVSSTEIRTALLSGQVEKANKMLGRAYSFCGQVIDGQHLGRQLGFPTINQQFEVGKLVPRNGVYVSRVQLDGEGRYGITNIGVRPTVDGNTLCAETNIFDCSMDLYGVRLKIELLAFIREEIKFDGIDRLKEQVDVDIIKAKRYIKGEISC